MKAGEVQPRCLLGMRRGSSTEQGCRVRDGHVGNWPAGTRVSQPAQLRKRLLRIYKEWEGHPNYLQPEVLLAWQGLGNQAEGTSWS